jgi:ATP-dependent Clp endopeptidase proteolytic subunit ClpP
MKSLTEIDPRINIAKAADGSVPGIPKPVIIRVGKFNEEAAKKFNEDMSAAHNTGQSIIPVVIDSYGGEVYSLLSMISDIENSQIPVATICIGKAMSCGSVLLTCGDEGHRYMDARGTVMIHDVSSMEWGKNEEIKAGAREVDRLQKLIFGIMAKNCGHDRKYFLDKIHERSHAEWYLTARTTKQNNIVNHIGVPVMKTKVSVEMEIEA